MVIFPKVTSQLEPVQVYKVGSVTSGFICMSEVLGTELSLPHAKHLGYTSSTRLLGVKEHLSYCRREWG